MTAYDATTRTVAGLAGFGPRYRLEIGEPDSFDLDWLRIDSLLVPDGPELTGLLKHEAGGRGHTSDHATALSLMAVYAGRVTAAALLCWALEGVVLDVRPENLWLKPAPDRGIEAVAVREATVLPGGLDTLYDVVLARHLLPLAEELHRRTRAGLRQLRGGVASGSALAFCAATQHTPQAAPDLLRRRWAEFVASAPADLGRLGEVATVDRAGREVLVYLRNTCCLYYSCEESAGTRCSSCCLTSRADRLTSYAQT